VNAGALLLNTLYVTTPEAHLYREGETVLVKVDREKRLQVPIHHLQAITCLGHVYLSPELLHLCLERNVSVSFLTEQARFLGNLEGVAHAGAWLRVNQHRAHAEVHEAWRWPRTSFVASSPISGMCCSGRPEKPRANPPGPWPLPRSEYA